MQVDQPLPISGAFFQKESQMLLDSDLSAANTPEFMQMPLPMQTSTSGPKTPRKLLGPKSKAPKSKAPKPERVKKPKRQINMKGELFPDQTPDIPKSAGIAPKKLLIRQPLKKSFKIKSKTIFPEPPSKPERRIDADLLRPLAPEDNTPIQIGTDQEEDDKIAQNLPSMASFQRSDKYGQDWYRSWSREAGYPGEDKIAVLVHFKKARDETIPQKSKYMTFKKLRKHSMVRMKEVPIPVRFGADLMFCEDPTLREIRLQALIKNPLDKPLPPKGIFTVVWRRTYADCSGYDEYMAKLDQNIKPQMRLY